jgi:putative peptidoglycan lipid II flippase
VWNLAIIVALIVSAEGRDANDLAVAAAVGSVVGSVLQFGVQLPTAIRLIRHLRPTLDAGSTQVRAVLANFGPVFFGRGVVQISAYVDSIIASLLGHGPVAALQSAQVLYTLPVSLFGMSVSAAELPAMSSATGRGEEITRELQGRLTAGLRRIAFFVVPSAAAFLALGDIIAAALFQTGRFTASDSTYVWVILAGSSVGLLAATMGRLYSSAYYALRDTRTPLRYALVRVVLSTILGLLAAIALPRALGLDPRWGAAGLTAAGGIAAWVEYLLLKRGLLTRLGPTGLPGSDLARLWGPALAGAAVGVGIQAALPGVQPVLRAVAVLVPFGLTYLGLTRALGVAEAKRFLGGSGRRPV